MDFENPSGAKFIEDVKKKLEKMTSRRDELVAELTKLERQIIGLQTYLSETESGETPSVLITRLTPQVVIDRIPKFRGRQITMVLDILRETGRAMNLDDIGIAAEQRGETLNRDSLRAQLWRAASAGVVEKRGQFYLFKGVAGLEGG